ncbi:hypothetical protein BC830DRAFT_1163306 [Chytriomyces sp. MP71]|nr:hypothetical protein BC830DRAFT_1163306 [Chytriomyces sp. MP71]
MTSLDTLSVKDFVYYSNFPFLPYSPFTQDLVDWFSAQNESTKALVFEGLCYQGVSQGQLAYLTQLYLQISAIFLIFNNTFLQGFAFQCLNSNFGPSALTSYQQQLSELGQIAPPESVFHWDPLTPCGCYWFQYLQPPETQLDSIEFICYQMGYSARDLQRAFSYLTAPIYGMQSAPNGLLNASQALISQCLEFSANPISRVAWFHSLDISRQIAAVDQLCNSPDYSTDQVAHVLQALTNGTVPAEVQLQAEECLPTHSMNWSQLIERFFNDPLNPQLISWFVSQPEWEKVRLIYFFTDGETVYSPPYRVYSILQIQNIFKEYLSHLPATQWTSQLQQTIAMRLESISQITLHEVYSYIANPITCVWVASQNSTVQIEFVNHVCTDLNMTDIQLLGFFRVLVHAIQPSSIVVDAIQMCDPVIQRNSLYMLHTVAFSVLAFASTIGLVYLTYFIKNIELPKVYIKKRIDPGEATLRHAFKYALTPFNIALLACFVALIGHDITWALMAHSYLNLFATSVEPAPIKQIFILSFMFAWTIAYVAFIWHRSEALLRHVWPRQANAIHVCLLATPFLFVGPLVSQTVEVATFILLDFVTDVLQAIAGITLLLLDLLFLACFSIFAAQATVDSPDARFSIISRFGMAANALCGVYSVLMILKPIFGNDLTAYFSYMVGAVVAIHLVMVMLVWMKVELHREEVGRDARLGERGVAGMVDGRRSKAPSWHGTIRSKDASKG